MTLQNAKYDDAVAELEKQGLSGYVATGDELLELKRTNNLNIFGIKSWDSRRQ